MIRKTLMVAALTGALVVASPLAAHATVPDTMGHWYAMTWTSTPHLYEINKTTGAATEIAVAPDNFITNGMAGIDFDSTNGFAYFIDYTNGGHLIKVDMGSGTFTDVGAIDADHVTGVDLGNNGEMWIVADNIQGTGDAFGKVNVSTGAVTLLGECPERIAALATSPNGVLYGFSYAGNIFTINQSTYTFTQVGTTSTEVLAADFDLDGNVILQDWGGNVASYNVNTNVETPLFQINGITWPGGEAFGIGGPTNGQTLAEAINGGSTAQETLPDTGMNFNGVWIGVGAVLAGGAALTVVRARRARKQ